MRTSVAIAGLLLASVALAQVPSGGSYTLPKQAIAGGGVRASGGGFVLVGTVWQSATGQIGAGAYALQQGFHSASGAAPTPDPIFQNGFE